LLIDDLVDSRWTSPRSPGGYDSPEQSRCSPCPRLDDGKRLVSVSEASLAVLLTNRLVDAGARPLSAGEYWALVAKVPALDVLLGADEVAVAKQLGGDSIEAGRITSHSLPRLRSPTSASASKKRASACCRRSTRRFRHG
jgi:hypothetical protein